LPWDSILFLKQYNEQCTKKTFILEVDYELKPASALNNMTGQLLHNELSASSVATTNIKITIQADHQK